MRNRLSRFWKGNRSFTFSFLIIIPAFFLTASLTFYALGIRINVSRSFPLGFYSLEKGEPFRGDLVFLKPPENAVVQWGRETGAISRATMFKRIYGMGGDEVEVSREGVRINGVLIENSNILGKTPDGTPIPSIAESGVIPQNSVWVISEYSKLSFDSRYFGTVSTSNIQSKAKPLWTW